MSWENAPALNKLTASQQGGKLGAQIWGVDHKGKLYTNSQETPGGRWAGWHSDWGNRNAPQEIYELAASQHADGGTQLWVLDKNRLLWSIKQDRPGSDWGTWQKDWNKPQSSFHFKKMAALWQGPNHGARFWGISEKGILISCPQIVPAGFWGAWSDWPKTPSDPNKNPPELPAEWIEVTACSQGSDGKGALWALDNKLQLWAMFQESPGGAWGKWQGPNWKNAPKLRNIAAVDMSAPSSPGSRDIILGACIFGITQDYRLVFNNQSRPGNDDWWGWSPASFKDELRGYEITAARQNNSSGRVWFVSNELGLVSQQVANSSPPGWERYWTPELPEPPEQPEES